MKVGILAGAFNPVTRAHVALVDAARSVVDEVICVVPRAYPHKEIHGATLAHRLEMLRSAGLRAEAVEGGRFIDIARELRRSRPTDDFYFICGRDAAERVLTWDHGCPVEQILDEFHLLVASRQGPIVAPPHLEARIHPLALAANFDEISSTEIRRRIASAEPWEHLVPEPITATVRQIYAKD